MFVCSWRMLSVPEQNTVRPAPVISVGPLPSQVLSVCVRLKALLHSRFSLWLDSVEWCIAAASGQATSHSHSNRSPINVAAWSKKPGAQWAAQRTAGLLWSSSNFHQVEENIISPVLLYLRPLSLVYSGSLIWISWAKTKVCLSVHDWRKV